MQINKIVLSRRATKRLSSIALYLEKEEVSKEFIRNYLNELKIFIKSTLTTFPLVGRDVSIEFGEGVRKLVYQNYSILYVINEEKQQIEILTIYRENQPYQN